MDYHSSYSLDRLVNEAERLVIDEVIKQLKEVDDDSIDNEECFIDIAAFALNHVRPLYRVNLLGRLYANAVTDEYLNEIERAVKKAIQKIRSNPPDEV